MTAVGQRLSSLQAAAAELLTLLPLRISHFLTLLFALLDVSTLKNSPG